MSFRSGSLSSGGRAIAILTLLPLGAAHAAEQRASLVVTAGASVSDNPFLSTSRQAKAMLTEITVRPVLSSKSERYEIEMSGTVGHRRYSNEQGSYLFGVASLVGSFQQSERLQLHASARYRHDVSADVIEDSAAAVDPQSVRKSLSADASATWRISERSDLSPSLSAESVSYDRTNGLGTYRRLASSISLKHRLSPYTTAGVKGGVMHYAQQGDSDATIFSAAVTFQHRLSPTIDIDGSLGAERPTFSSALKGQEKVLLSGNVQACRRGLRNRLCARSAVSTSPSGLGTIERRLSGGVTYAHQLAEFSNLSFGVDYQQSSPLGGPSQDPLQYLQASASFDEKITKFLSIETYLRYRRRDGVQSAGSAQAGVNLRFQVGRN